MDLPDRAEARSWQGREVVDRDGDSLGRCIGVFADTDTGLPEWVLVDVDGRRAFVPAGDAEQSDDGVRVQFVREQVRSAPDVGDVAQLSEQDEQTLYTHYGVAFSTSASDSVLPVGAAPETAAPESATPGSAPGSTPSDATPERPSATPQPAAWAPRAVPAPTGSGSGSSAAPLVAVAGLVGAVWLALRERDRRAARQRSVAGRTRGLRRQLSAGSSVLAELTQQAAERTQQAASGAAATTVDATRAGRAASRAAARDAARTAARRSAQASKQAARRRKQLARNASGAGSAVTGSTRQLAHAATSTASAAGDAVTDTSRQLAQVASAAGSAVSDTSRSVADSVAAVPVRAARRGRKVRRSVGRKLWDAVLVTAAGAGYVAGARAGRERYDEIAQWASRTAERPEVQRVVDSVAGTATDPQQPPRTTGAPLEAVGPQTG